MGTKNTVVKGGHSHIRIGDATRLPNSMRHAIVKYSGTYNKHRIVNELTVNVLQLDVLFANPAIFRLSVDVCGGAYSVVLLVQPCLIAIR